MNATFVHKVGFAPQFRNFSEVNSSMTDWAARDESLVSSMFDEDLRRAIELSKVEYEKEEQDRSCFKNMSNAIDVPFVKPVSKRLSLFQVRYLFHYVQFRRNLLWNRNSHRPNETRKNTNHIRLYP